MGYVDAFVASVPDDRLQDDASLSARVGAIFKEHGALSYVEAHGDDVPPGKRTSFPLAVQAKEGETVVIGFSTYRDRAHRDEVQTAVRSDPRMGELFGDAPIDGARMIFGGFTVVTEV